MRWRRLHLVKGFRSRQKLSRKPNGLVTSFAESIFGTAAEALSFLQTSFGVASGSGWAGTLF